MRIIRLDRCHKALIKAGILLDGTGGQPRENVEIVIIDGMVRKIYPSLPQGSPFILPAENSIEDEADQVLKVDCSELTIMPGLIDCHVHLALDGVNFEDSLKRWNQEMELNTHLEDALESTRYSGVLAVRDGGDKNRIGLYAARLAGEAKVPPLVMAAGQALRKAGMYGSFLGEGLGATNIKRAVPKIAGSGVKQVKVLVSGMVSFREYGKAGPLQWDREELSFLVTEAHAAGLKVMAHANSDRGTALAVQCGVDSLEHGYFISRKTLSQMAQRGIAWVPTIIPVAVQLKAPCKHKYNQAQLAVIEKTCRHQQSMVAMARELGVTVGAGTDAGASGVRHGVSYPEELKLLVEAGFSPAEVINIATARGAGILGLEKQMGRVGPGMRAYLIGVRGNPLLDLDVLKKPEVIIFRL